MRWQSINRKAVLGGSMKSYLLGIDIGTSSCKAAVFNRHGEAVAMTSKSYPAFYPEAGWVEQNPADWWMAVCQGISELLADSGIGAGEIAGIGVDGQSWAAVAIGKNGDVLFHTPLWLDTRTEAICQELKERIGAEHILQLSGNSLQPSYTTAKIIWYQRNYPDLYPQIEKILQSNSYIVYKLTGMLTQDLSQGYGLHCFNMQEGTWDFDMCRELGIAPALLPDIYPCHQVVGTVTEAAARVTGLAAGTPVVAGGLDAACGALGAGVIHPGETQEQGGQAGGMSICMDACKSDARLILGRHVVPERWLLQGGTTGGGGVMRWLEQELGNSGESENTLVEFNRLAASVRPGSEGVIFLPYMAGERSPIWNPSAKGVYYGLDYSKSRGHLIRSAMEGVAMSLRHNLEVAEEAGAKVDTLRCVGGSANSWLWTQIKSDLTGKPAVVPAADTATTLGAALLAGVGIGMYQSFTEAVQITVKDMRCHKPNQENAPVYDRCYHRYLELYERLAPLMCKKGEM